MTTPPFPPTSPGRGPRNSGPTAYHVLQQIFAAAPHPAAPPEPGSLLDHAAARDGLERLRWSYDQGLYTYQQPLEGRAGPRARLAGRAMLLLSSDDFLGLLGHPAIEEAAIAAIRRHGTGSAGARMFSGTTVLHQELERELAAFKRVEAAITFSSGYLANVAAIATLVGPRDRVVLDARAHSSLRDACALTRVPVRPFRHNDPESLRRELARGPAGQRTLIIVEGLYAMDGDVCPLPDIVALKREFGAYLLVDEAHSLGVLGASGRGVDELFGLPVDSVDVWTGSLGKALAANGGFVSGSRELIVYLQHTAAPFWFSAALCPAAAAAACAALRVARREPERIARLRRNAVTLRERLRTLGYDTGAATSAIVPLLIGHDEGAWRLARRLFDRGVVAQAVVPPAVPRGEARLRVCATAAQSERDLAEATSAFATLGEPIELPA